MSPTEQFLFAAKSVDDAWLAEFARRRAENPAWLDECRAEVTTRYATDATARDGFSRVAYGLMRGGDAASALAWYADDWTADRMGRWQFLRLVELLLAQDRVADAEVRVEHYYGRHPEARDGWATIAAHAQKLNDAVRATGLLRRDAAAGRLSPFWLVRLAEIEARGGDAARAEQLVLEAYRLDAGQRDSFARLAQVCYDAGDETAGDTWLARDHELQRLSPAPRLRLATALARGGDWLAAEELVAAAYRDDPKLRDGYLRLARLKVSAEDWAAAAELCERDRAAGRLSAGALPECAQVRGQAGDFAGATELVTQALAAGAKLTDAYANLARLAWRAGDAATARALFDRERRAGRLSSLRRLDYAQLLAETSPEEAEDLVTEVYAANPAIKNACARIGVIACEHGRVPSALPYFCRDLAAGRLTPAWSTEAVRRWAQEEEARVGMPRALGRLVGWLTDDAAAELAAEVFGDAAVPMTWEALVRRHMLREGCARLRVGTIELPVDDAPQALARVFGDERYFFASEHPQPRILDATAGCGLAVAYWRWLHPLAEITAIASEATLAAMLRRNIARNGWSRVDAREVAAGAWARLLAQRLEGIPVDLLRLDHPAADDVLAALGAARLARVRLIGCSGGNAGQVAAVLRAAGFRIAFNARHGATGAAGENTRGAECLATSTAPDVWAVNAR